MLVITGLFEQIILGVVRFAMIAVDIVAFFVMIEVLATKWPNLNLLGLDRVGAPVVDAMSEAMDSVFRIRTMPGKLLASLIVLAVCRLALNLLFHPFIWMGVS